jgi:hypothetical protein
VPPTRIVFVGESLYAILPAVAQDSLSLAGRTPSAKTPGCESSASCSVMELGFRSSMF